MAPHAVGFIFFQPANTIRLQRMIFAGARGYMRRINTRLRAGRSVILMRLIGRGRAKAVAMCPTMGSDHGAVGGLEKAVSSIIRGSQPWPAVIGAPDINLRPKSFGFGSLWPSKAAPSYNPVSHWSRFPRGLG